MRWLAIFLAATVAVVGLSWVVLAAAPAGSAPPHILVVVEENLSYSQVIGNSQLPYINSLTRYGLATSWSDLTHPSLPDYLGLIAGSIENSPADTVPSAGVYTDPTLVDELASAGIGWRAYMEDMRSACDLTDTYGPNSYDVNHDPFVYFTSIRNSPSQCNNVVPFGRLASDLAANTAPPFLWVTPNTQDDMHTGTPAQADSWLQSLMQTVTASQWWAEGGQLVLTWDEGAANDQVATIVVGPAAQGGARLSAGGNHYGTLRGIEEAYGVGLLGNSASTSAGDLGPLLQSWSTPPTPVPTPAPASPPPGQPPPPPLTHNLYAVDGYGGLRAGSSPPLVSSATWPGWNIARGVAMSGSGGGYVLDGWGGLHPFGTAPPAAGTAYWPGWDIARGIATIATAPGSGYVLDGYGALHPFGGAPAAGGEPYWPGFDIARGVALCPSGIGGYVLDGWGGVHPFNGAPAVAISAYWPGWDIARGLAVLSDCSGGYVLDGLGGLHPFGSAPAVSGAAYWPNWDIARGVTLVPGTASGYVVDGYGGFHPFNGAPSVVSGGYAPGQNIVRGVAGA